VLTSQVTPVLHNNNVGGGVCVDQSEVTASLCTASCLQYRHVGGGGDSVLIYQQYYILYFDNIVFFLVVRTEIL
jgi:hypothetical protein